MAFAKVQTTSGSGTGTGLTTGKTLSGAPTSGNLLIAFVYTGNSTTQTTLTYNTASWTQFDRAVGQSDGDVCVTALFRYVQIGDTATMPAFCTAGSTFFAYAVIEVSGVSGTWAADYLSSSNNQERVSTNTVSSYSQKTFAANSFAVVGFAKYNEGAAGTLSAGWTADENTFNGGNYGAYGLGHQAFSSAGSAVAATFTSSGTNSNVMGIVHVILTPSQPTVPNVVRARYVVGPSVGGLPGSVLFGGAPKPGNLLIGMLSWSDGSAAAPTVNTSSWTNYISALNSSDPIMLGLYRYAQGGDTLTLPALCTGGSAKWSISIIEITGVSGVFANDHISDKAAYQASGATLTTTPDTTTHNSQLCLTGFMEFGPSTIPSESGATAVSLAGDSSALLSFGSTQDFKPSSGSSVQTVWTLSSGSDKSGYVQSIFGSGSIDGSGSPTQASTAGAVGTVAPTHAGSGSPMQAASAATAHALSAGPSPMLTGVHARGIAGDIEHQNSNIRGVQSFAVANAVSFYATPIAYFPGVRIMRNTPVPGVGAMDDDPVAGIGRMYVCGPQPVSREVTLVGAQAICAVAGLQTRDTFSSELFGVAAAGFAGTVTTTSV